MSEPRRAKGSAEGARLGAPSAFVVNVSRLRRAPGTRRAVHVAAPLEDLAVTGSGVPEGAEVEVEVTVEAISGGVSVVGEVTAPWAGDCRRCLQPASGTLRVPVRELFAPGGDGEDVYPMSGDEIDLEPVARDAVLLELPVAPLCRPACLGLCPDCGANRNEDPCGGHERTDPRWAALDVLRDGHAG